MKLFCLLLALIVAALGNEQIPFKTSVIERNLLVENPTAASIVKEHQNYNHGARSQRLFRTGNTLAYVTPWNNHGYDVAKTFRGKFTHLSPVWFQIKRSAPEKYAVTGGHDVDLGWLNDVKFGCVDGKGHCQKLTETTTESEGVEEVEVPKILPRFRTEGWTNDDLSNMLSPEVDHSVDYLAFVHAVFDQVVEYGFDGAVLEMDLPHYFMQVIKLMADTFHAHGLLLFVVLPPNGRYPEHIKALDAEIYQMMHEFIDGFSLMTYDYSSSHSPGPTSPYYWMHDEVVRLSPATETRAKIYLGLNLYGYDYVPSARHGESVVGSKFLEIMNSYLPTITWHDEVAEHEFSWKVADELHSMYFPTLLSIDARIQLAEDLGTSIALWEIGQGLDYFYDLL